MLRLNKGLFAGLICFCLGYIAHDIFGDERPSLTRTAEAFAGAVGPDDTHWRLVTPVHSFDGLDAKALARNPIFRGAVYIVACRLHSGEPYPPFNC